MEQQFNYVESSLKIYAADNDKCNLKKKALNVLATEIPLEDLVFIASKIHANPKGLVDKLHKYKMFI